MQITYGEIFAGIGAANAAWNPLGWENTYFVENSKTALAQYLYNWDDYFRGYIDNHTFTKQKILYIAEKWYSPRKFSDAYKVGLLPKADVMMTSPPCQSFSAAGNRKGLGARKGDLFFETHRIIAQNRPKIFVLENVYGMTTLSEDMEYDEKAEEAIGEALYRQTSRREPRNTFTDIVLPSLGFMANGGSLDNGSTQIIVWRGTQDRFFALTPLPYKLYYQVLDAEQFGLPLLRKRIFIVGVRRDIATDFVFPLPSSSPPHSIYEYVDPDRPFSKDFRFKIYHPGTLAHKQASNAGKKITSRGIRRDVMVDTFLTKERPRGISIERSDGTYRSFADEQRRALLGFPPSFNSTVVSRSAAIKNFGNSISVPVLYKIGEQIEKVLWSEDPKMRDFL
jgi:DNA (cytosine-5)-methyltransferase 1